MTNFTILLIASFITAWALLSFSLYKYLKRHQRKTIRNSVHQLGLATRTYISLVKGEECKDCYEFIPTCFQMITVADGRTRITDMRTGYYTFVDKDMYWDGKVRGTEEW